MSNNGVRRIDVSSLRKVGTLAKIIASMPHRDPRYALFLGAGASRSSGVPTAERLTLLWQRRVFLDVTDRSAWSPHFEVEFQKWVKDRYPAWRKNWENSYGRHPSDYSTLFSYSFPDADARQGFIEQITSGIEPGAGYIYLTALAIAGYFHTFVTTNFDDLIHDALFRYGGLKPAVAAFDAQAARIRPESPRPKIVKLHGDFLYNNIRNTGPELVRLDLNMEQKLERTCEGHGLVVLGYSGQDNSVMAPLRTLLHRRDRLNHGLHWCLYCSKDQASQSYREVPEDLYRMWEAYPDKLHLYDVAGFDDTMEAIYSVCNCEPPPDLAYPQEKALYARLRSGLENADQSWRLSPAFSRLLQRFQMATAESPSQVITCLDNADQAHRSGNHAMDNGAFDEAIQHFNEAVRLAELAVTGADDHQKVRAYRRLGGSRSNVAEALVKQKKVKSLAKLPADRLKSIREDLHQSLRDIRKGVEIDTGLRSPPDLRGHRINLWFNGLISYGLLRQIEPDILEVNRSEAVSWFERMVSDEYLGDEYARFLAAEIGGRDLMEELRRDPEGDASPPEAGQEMLQPDEQPVET